jgi:hypothetical protein
MTRMLNVNQVAAVAALSAAVGYFAGGSCSPMHERIARSDLEPPTEQRCEIYNTDAHMPRLVGLVAHRAIRRSAPLIRSELGAGESETALIQYTFTVNGRGVLQMAEANVSCGGMPCPGTSELPDLIGVLIASEWKVEPTGRECAMQIIVEVPPKEGSIPGRRIRLPAAEQGIDL